MSGQSPSSPRPTDVVVHQHSRVLEIAFDDGARWRIPFELMRVLSPSAEVMGHGPGQEVLQSGKREVLIEDLAQVGHYALQPRFSDGHDSGIFTWDYLYRLGRDQAMLWDQYLARLQEAGRDRDDPMPGAAARQCASSQG
ncbi:gamma-butyrobetaine hydroxylase-like domain-containing protein [Roseateles sp. BYS180W]|uniref:Gamma-butyrobetaine hydroxylase-like domain-containing protein n=1 Tax=Roseateles rivi TaxID=3299028 RepID=A0ABW7FXI9_9BURK